MVIRTFFDRNNTIISNDLTNTGRNPVVELFYGGTNPDYSRYLFHFDETRLREEYNCGQIGDLSKVTHRLRMTNTGAFDTDLLGKTTCGGKKRACSFDLILYPINQEWDEGVGYDYGECRFIGGVGSTSSCPSNWVDAQTNIPWSGGNGVYSGSTSGLTIATQHFELGNEDVYMDITDVVNGIITGDTNYGFVLSFPRTYEALETDELEYVGFWSRHTQTFYEPFIETIYNNPIQDDRNQFYLDKPNKLYLYANAGGNPVCLDQLPCVTILDSNEELFSGCSQTVVEEVSVGVYCVEVMIPSSAATDCSVFYDVWSGVTINGVERPPITLQFGTLSADDYYNVGTDDLLPKKFGIGISGIKRDERIKRGEIRKVFVNARIPYTVNQQSVIDGLEYRLYVREGKHEYTVIDYQPVNRTANHNYFLLDTASLIPNTYYLDIKVKSNLEVNILNETMKFDIVSQSELRESQQF